MMLYPELNEKCQIWVSSVGLAQVRLLHGIVLEFNQFAGKTINPAEQLDRPGHVNMEDMDVGWDRETQLEVELRPFLGSSSYLLRIIPWTLSSEGEGGMEFLVQLRVLPLQLLRKDARRRANRRTESLQQKPPTTTSQTTEFDLRHRCTRSVTPGPSRPLVLPISINIGWLKNTHFLLILLHKDTVSCFF